MRWPQRSGPTGLADGGTQYKRQSNCAHPPSLQLARRCVCARVRPLHLRPPCSNNSLTALPDDFLSAFPANSIILVDLSRNKFTAAGAANFRSALAQTLHLDVSFNNIGPTVPPSLGQWPGLYTSLLLMGCGITDVQPNTFAGSGWRSIDLSLNDLRSGLHPQSFSGANSLSQIGLSNCNLRTSSLVPGVFMITARWTPSWSMFMDNLAADLSGMSWDTHFPYLGLSPKVPLDPRVLSAAEINPPGQSHTNKISVTRYLESWANFFDPFPVGVFYTSAPESVFVQPSWSSMALGGEGHSVSSSSRSTSSCISSPKMMRMR